MPIYEYYCDACGYEEEHWCKMGECFIHCPQCHSTHYQKRMSAPACFTLTSQSEGPICPTTGRLCGRCHEN